MRRGHGQIRRSQALMTYGPGSLIDLPQHSAIVGGLDSWPRTSELDEIVEPRLSAKLQAMTSVPMPRLFAPPAASNDPRERTLGIAVWRFPQWFVVQDEGAGDRPQTHRRLVHRGKLDDRGYFEGLKVVPTRFVCACPKGHIEDLDWYAFVHGSEDPCRRQLWLEERGTSGDLADLVVRCDCEKSIHMHKATESPDKENPILGSCRGSMPWLGRGVREDGGCGIPNRLLVRTAANAYFAQIVSVLSLPDQRSAVSEAVDRLWSHLEAVEEQGDLRYERKKTQVREGLEGFTDEEVLEAILAKRKGGGDERPVKQVELDALLGAPVGFGEDVPVQEDFHARRLADHVWRPNGEFQEEVECVVQLHRLREVMALVGFTRFEANMPDIHGEYDPEIPRSPIARETTWFPAVENRGEGLFVQLRAAAISRWMERSGVKARCDELVRSHESWNERRHKTSDGDAKSSRRFPGGPYVLLHTLSHLLLESLAMTCGYPATSIRERIYADAEQGRYGLLLYTGSPDAEGTLGGLVQEGRNLALHLANALRQASLCSNDPICAQHAPGDSLEERWLHGAACHACTLVAETSCEMRNEYLDRALVVPVLGLLGRGAAFFGGTS
ncbi:MAG: DUF1998 domain-containing protein [Planctomycetes bacterium]|nr:DUF1998 domain-containing protein [Planctomycetota bacterium]